jgi:hypothetical protein
MDISNQPTPKTIIKNKSTIYKKNIKKRIIANAIDAFITLGSEPKKLPIILLNIY